MPGRKGNPGLMKASSLELVEEIRDEYSRQLVAFENWANIDQPDLYVEKQTGKYVYGLEHLLETAVKENDIDRARAILNDLIRLSKMGRAKADIEIKGPNKLRPERDLSALPLELLRQAAGLDQEDNS